MREYDTLDRLILKEMRQSSKQSARDLAEKLGSHVNTVSHRLKRLERNNVILKYSADIDYRKVGFDLHAIAMIRVKGGRVGDPKQLDFITKMPEIQALYAVTGQYDVVCLIRAKDRDHLAELLKRMQAKGGISRSNTLMVLYTYKHPYEFNPLIEIGKEEKKTKKP